MRMVTQNGVSSWDIYMPGRCCSCTARTVTFITLTSLGFRWATLIELVGVVQVLRTLRTIRYSNRKSMLLSRFRHKVMSFSRNINAIQMKTWCRCSLASCPTSSQSNTVRRGERALCWLWTGQVTIVVPRRESVYNIFAWELYCQRLIVIKLRLQNFGLRTWSKGTSIQIVLVQPSRKWAPFGVMLLSSFKDVAKLVY